jgi:hypothetical protein
MLDPVDGLASPVVPDLRAAGSVHGSIEHTQRASGQATKL